jgi:hypothetical protein
MEISAIINVKSTIQHKNAVLILNMTCGEPILSERSRETILSQWDYFFFQLVSEKLNIAQLFCHCSAFLCTQSSDPCPSLWALGRTGLKVGGHQVAIDEHHWSNPQCSLH